RGLSVGLAVYAVRVGPRPRGSGGGHDRLLVLRRHEPDRAATRAGHFLAGPPGRRARRAACGLAVPPQRSAAAAQALQLGDRGRTRGRAGAPGGQPVRTTLARRRAGPLAPRRNGRARHRAAVPPATQPTALERAAPRLAMLGA